MSDLFWGYIILAVWSTAMFVCARHLTSNRKGRRIELWAACTVLSIVGYAWLLWDNILLAKLVPFSSLIVLGNWFPPLLGFLAGLTWNGVSGSWPKKGVYVGAMLILAVVALVKPIWGTVPDCGSQWQNGVCLQTTPHTCSPCCAATILTDAGIPTTEEEMAELCLTRKGTLWQGLYRGLKIKTRGTDFDVEIFQGNLEHLRELVKDGPLILTVGIPSGPVDEIYTTRYGWSRGELHSAVLFGFGEETGSEADQRVEMGDPGVEEGREEWSVADLRVLYRGRGLRLIPR